MRALRAARPGRRDHDRQPRGRAVRVDFGETDQEPEVVITMDAETAHRYLLGEVDMTVAWRGAR